MNVGSWWRSGASYPLSPRIWPRREVDQRAVRDGRPVALIQGSVRPPPLPGASAAYYEWRHDPTGKTPFAIARKDGEPVAFGGMWEEWRSPEGETLRTFATLTTEANPELALIQDRMPVIIE